MIKTRIFHKKESSFEKCSTNYYSRTYNIIPTSQNECGDYLMLQVFCLFFRNGAGSN